MNYKKVHIEYELDIDEIKLIRTLYAISEGKHTKEEFSQLNGKTVILKEELFKALSMGKAKKDRLTKFLLAVGAINEMRRKMDNTETTKVVYAHWIIEKSVINDLVRKIEMP